MQYKVKQVRNNFDDVKMLCPGLGGVVLATICLTLCIRLARNNLFRSALNNRRRLTQRLWFIYTK